MSNGDLIIDGFVILLSLWACWAKWGVPVWHRIAPKLHMRMAFLTPSLAPVLTFEGPSAAIEEGEEVDDRPGYDTEDDEGEEDDEVPPPPLPPLPLVAPAAAPTPTPVVMQPVHLRPIEPDAITLQQRAAAVWQAWMTRGMSAALHLIVIGQTGAGKTTVLQVFVASLVGAGLPVVVCDPDAAAGDWPGTQVFGAGDDFKGITQAFKAMQKMAQDRRQARAGGQREFPPFWCILDEYADIQDECTLAGVVVENALRRWRKLNMHLVIGVQDTQVKTMGFERRSSLLNHARIVTLRINGSGYRTAQLDDEAPISIPQLEPPRGPTQIEETLHIEEGAVDPVGPLDILSVGVPEDMEDSDSLLDHAVDKDAQIRIMLAAGASYATIAERLRVATTRISKVKKDFMLET